MNIFMESEAALAAMPVACTLDADALAARSAALRDELFQHAEERQELPDGVRFLFPGSDAFRDKLLAFVVAERTCCAFFRIELAFAPGLGPIWLTLTGPEGVKAFVQQRFVEQPQDSLPASCATGSCCRGA